MIMKEQERQIDCLDGKNREKEHERRRIQRLDHDHRDAHADGLPALRDHSVRRIGPPDDYRPGFPSGGHIPTRETATTAADGAVEVTPLMRRAVSPWP